MKMPRFFILIGACALLSTIALQSIEATICPSSASAFFPVMRADPRAGDPEEPGFADKLPFDEGGESSGITLPYELSTQDRPVLRETTRSSWWSRIRRVLFVSGLFGY